MSIDPQLYPSGLDHILNTTALATATFKSVLLGTGYTFDPTDVAIADLGAHALDQSAAITGLTVTAGLVTAADPVFTPTGGDAVGGYVIWDSTNNKLIGYSGRQADGRPISFTTSTAGLTQHLASGQLLRFGGTA